MIRAWKLVAEDYALNIIGKSIPQPTQPTIHDKWVGSGYIENAGIPERLLKEGYRIQWIFAEEETNYLEFKGWEMVVHTDNQGEKWHLKWLQPDHPYIVLMKHKIGA